MGIMLSFVFVFVSVSANKVEAVGKIKLNEDKKIYKSYGVWGTDLHRKLKKNSSWKVFDVQEENNHAWYNLGNDQWISEKLPSVIKLNKDSNLYPEDSSDTLKTGRILPKNSSWKVKSVTYDGDNIWYQLGNHQWVSTADQFNNFDRKVITVKSHPVMIFKNFGNNRQYTYQDLSTNSKWKVLSVKKVNDVYWYQVGYDQWVTLDQESNSIPNLTDAKIRLIHQSPIYYHAQDEKLKNKTSLSTAQSYLATKVIDGFTWYQIARNSWISPAYDIAGNWDQFNIKLSFQF